jgi:NADH:ubiquinone oxidoreductase subunit
VRLPRDLSGAQMAKWLEWLGYSVTRKPRRVGIAHHRWQTVGNAHPTGINEDAELIRVAG